MINQYSFSCTPNPKSVGDVGCSETAKIREDFSDFLNSVKNNFMSALKGGEVGLEEDPVPVEWIKRGIANQIMTKGKEFLDSLDLAMGDIVLGIDRREEITRMLENRDNIAVATDLEDCFRKVLGNEKARLGENVMFSVQRLDK